jgi:diphosphomevalonate decarboxylase
MGKRAGVLNIPENDSVSLTLDSLCTRFELSCVDSESSDRFHIKPGPSSPRLSEEGIRRMIRHVERVEIAVPPLFAEFGMKASSRLREAASIELRSANTFPVASGIASSASSFAAITLATALACAHDGRAFSEEFARVPLLRRRLAALSREGSGSSCRSFEGPFVHWKGEDTVVVESRLPELSHFVILVSSEVKTVSSSEAHRRVKSSPLWEGRPERANERCAGVLEALKSGDLHRIAHLAWAESWEMHSLFHTSAEPFTYWQAGTVDALRWLAPSLGNSEPPIVTMDAGPNIHVIVPRTAHAEWRERLERRFGSAALLEDRPGTGAVLEA